ncbi:unnamed protein product [Rhizoctonia solani]|uniref:BTB domain-containing protein n=1 Tax=Rhizoctonia solani TaxID=456999 RepID=A0A8H2WU16_9AGAM|nr:unnamed protein product [Rhizoctonia solani]
MTDPAPTLPSRQSRLQTKGDLVLKSVDGQEFRAHSLMLSLHSPVFADMFEIGSHASDEPIQLAETGDMVDLMLKFMYPRQSADVSSLEVLDKALHVAKKYELDDMYQRLRQQLLSDGSPASVYTDPRKALGIALAHGFKKEMHLAAGLAHQNYDFTSVDGLLKLAESAPEAIPWIVVIGIPSVKSKVISEVLFNYSEHPMLPPDLCKTCNAQRAHQNGRHSPPEWQARWSHAVSAELLKRPIEDCKTFFDLPFLCQVAFGSGGTPIWVGSGVCACLEKLAGAPVAYNDLDTGDRVFPREPDCFSHWSYKVYNHLCDRLKRIEDLDKLIVERDSAEGP